MQFQKASHLRNRCAAKIQALAPSYSSKVALVTSMRSLHFSTALAQGTQERAFTQSYLPGPQPYIMPFESITYIVGLFDPSDYHFIHLSALPSIYLFL